MEITGLLTALVVGLIIGALGRLMARGRQNIPIWLTLLAGVIAAALGTVFVSVLGLSDTRGIDGIELIIQVGLAAVGVGAVVATSGQRRQTPDPGAG
jgi:uncharacterized membrane protein YeaQ/YmgE (transglycosylase-associated protein family)